MRVFLDTSALYALLDAEDADHRSVSEALAELRESKALVTTTNYVIVETLAICQRRLGMGAARMLQEEFAPLLEVEWIGPEAHEEAGAAMMAANRRDLSLVDCVSFEVMRRLGIRRAFTLDEHFREQGFECVP